MRLQKISPPALNFSLFHLADLARDSGRWPDAVSLYREAVASLPDDASLLVQYGHALKETGLTAQAEIAYRHAIFLSPADHDIRLQLGHLLKLCGDYDGSIKHYREAFALSEGKCDAARELENLRSATPLPDEIRFDYRPILVDVSDIVHYAQKFAFPTGIQRVQMAVIDALLSERAVCRSIAFVMRPQSGGWMQLASTTLRDITKQLKGQATVAPSLSNTDCPIPTEALRWPRGATLLMLGTAWDDLSHSASLAEIKAGRGLRIATFIHDLIPIERPDLCVPGLPYRFRTWLQQALTVTDCWVSNSEYTSAQLRDFAIRNGIDEPVTTAVPLNAPLPRDNTEIAEQKGLSETRLKFGFDPLAQPFILCVGTLEPRKNHKTLLAAWRRLCIAMPSPPALVLVGKIGWSASATIRLIQDAKDAGMELYYLGGIADETLHVLYKYCLFNIFPSILEGWGLPVTEALGYRKLSVVGRHSGISESAGEFGYFVDINRESELYDAMLQLSTDSDQRHSCEVVIAEKYQRKTWLQVAVSIIDAACGER